MPGNYTEKTKGQLTNRLNRSKGMNISTLNIVFYRNTPVAFSSTPCVQTISSIDENYSPHSQTDGIALESSRNLEKKMEDRRSYLKRTGLVLLSLAVSSKAIAASTPGEKKSQQPSMIVDMNRCMGCQSCTIACKDQNQTPDGFFNTRVTTSNHGNYPQAWQAYKPELCNHCDNAPCITACGYDATFQLDNGIVVVDWNKCTGCGECVPSCPYDARFLDPDHDNKADKCDFCITRLEQSLEPACVETCPAGARIFGDLQNPQGDFAASLAALEAEQPALAANSSEKVLYTSARKG